MGYGEVLTISGIASHAGVVPKKDIISLYIEPDQLAALKKLSEESLAPVSALIRRAVEEFLESRKKRK